MLPVLPIPPSSQRPIVVSPTGVEGIQLQIGQEVTARVLAINAEGQLLLDLEARRFWARSAVPLEPGRAVNLKVLETAPQLTLQVLSEPATLPETQSTLQPLARLLAAQQNAPATGPAVNPELVLEALQVLAKSRAGSIEPRQLEQLRQLLGPLPLNKDSGAVLETLRTQLENSGLFFETRLRELLEIYRGSPETALNRLSSDLKMLLAELGGKLQGLPPAPQHPIKNLAGELPELIRQLQSAPDSQPAALKESTVLLAAGFKSLLEQTGKELVTLAAQGRASLERTETALRQVIQDFSRMPAQQETGSESGAMRQLMEETRGQLIRLQASLPHLESSPEVAWNYLKTEVRVILERFQSAMNRPDFTLKPLLESNAGKLHLLMQEIDATVKSWEDVSRLSLRQVNGAIQEILTKTANDPAWMPASTISSAKPVLEQLQALQGQLQEKLAVEAFPTPAETIRQMAVALKSALTDQLLSRQTETALQWMREGIFETTLPVQYQFQQSPARIRFQMDPRHQGKDRRHLPKTVDIRMDLPEMGKLEAWAQWLGSEIEVKIFLENQSAVRVFESQLQELSRSLEAAGFRQVQLEVKVDPVRLYKKELVPEPQAPGGSILSIRV